MLLSEEHFAEGIRNLKSVAVTGVGPEPAQDEEVTCEACHAVFTVTAEAGKHFQATCPGCGQDLRKHGSLGRRAHWVPVADDEEAERYPLIIGRKARRTPIPIGGLEAGRNRPVNVTCRPNGGRGCGGKLAQLVFRPDALAGRWPHDRLLVLDKKLEHQAPDLADRLNSLLCGTGAAAVLICRGCRGVTAAVLRGHAHPEYASLERLLSGAI